MRDFLTELAQELEDLGYRDIRLIHQGGYVYLDQLGTAGFEHFASITESIVLEEPVSWRMRTQIPSVHTVEVRLTVSDNPELVDVTVESMNQSDALNISDMLGRIKEGY